MLMMMFEVPACHIMMIRIVMPGKWFSHVKKNQTEPNLLPPPPIVTKMLTDTNAANQLIQVLRLDGFRLSLPLNFLLGFQGILSQLCERMTDR